MKTVTLYTKPGCGLCHDALEVLKAQRARTPFELVQIDITTTDDLMRDYGIRIPVVDIDGEETFEITVDPEQLAVAVGV